MTFKRTSGSDVIRLSDGARIPADPKNVDYQDFLRWKQQGNLEARADPEPAAKAETPRERLESRLGITIAQLKALLA